MIVVKIVKNTGEDPQITVYGTEEQVAIRYNDQVRIVDPTPDNAGWNTSISGTVVYSIDRDTAIGLELPAGRSLYGYLMAKGRQEAEKITPPNPDAIRTLSCILNGDNFEVRLQYS